MGYVARYVAIERLTEFFKDNLKIGDRFIEFNISEEENEEGELCGQYMIEIITTDDLDEERDALLEKYGFI